MSLGWKTALVAVCLFAAPAYGEEAPVEVFGATGVKSAGNRASAFDADAIAGHMDRVATPGLEGDETAAATVASAGLSLGGFVRQMVFALLVVVGAIYGLTYLLKKFSGGPWVNSTGPLRILAKQSISQKSNVYVVAALDRFLIIGETSQGLNCLCEFGDSDENRAHRKNWGWDAETAANLDPGAAPLSGPKESFQTSFDSQFTELERELDLMREGARR